MSSWKKGKTEGEDYSHPSADESGRYALDQLLRKHGWKIYSRKGETEPLWEKGGFIMRQVDILCGLDQEEVWDAEYREKLYWEGFE